MASGNFGGGNGSSASPFIIEDILDLNALRNKSQFFQLAHDIDMDVWPFNAWEGWKPIEGFSGTLYGKGHSIKNLFIDRPDENYIGLFGASTNSNLYDIKIENASVVGRQYVGTLIGRMSFSTTRYIQRCSASGTVKGLNYVGGIAGQVYGYYGHVFDCVSSCHVVGTGNYIGGIGGSLYGQNSSYIETRRCLFVGTIESSLSSYGGITGYFHTPFSKFYDCYYIEGNGKGVDSNIAVEFSREKMERIDAYNQNFYRERFENKRVWFVRPPELPRLAYEAMPEEEPRVFIKKSDGFYTNEDSLWINAGQTLEEVDSNRGVLWTKLIEDQWWKSFEGEEIEIVVISQVENPYISVMTETSVVTEDIADAGTDVSVNSLIMPETALTAPDIVLECLQEERTEEELNVSVMSGVYEQAIPENRDLLIVSDRKLDQQNDEGVANVFELVSDPVAGHDREIIFENDNKIDASGKEELVAINSAESDNSETFESLEMVGTVAAHTRYALSIDGGDTWKSYDGEKWITVNRDNISYRGMSHDFVSSLGYFDYKKLIPERAYLHDVQVIAFLSSHYDSGKIAVKNMTVEYFHNQGAFLADAEILPDTIHNQYAILKARLVDTENDKISYRVLIKRFGEDTFKSVDPLGEGWFEKKDGDVIRHSYDHNYFDVGENVVRVMLKDQRGIITSEDFSLFLDNENPWITATYDRFKMSLAIGDEDQDDVSYRVFINGNMLFDFTDYFATPVSFIHRWKSKELNLGEENTIKVEVKDIIGEVTSTSFKVSGHYNNIMFQDPLGKFYTTDLGELLQYLDFGIIVGGTVSEPAPVKVLNDTGLVLKDLTLAMERGSRNEGVSIEISSREMPFEPMEKVEFEGIMPVHDTKEFYIRVNAHDRVDYIDDFIVSASADEADK